MQIHARLETICHFVCVEAALDSRAMVAALKPAEITVCSSVRLKMAEETPARFACFPGLG